MNDPAAGDSRANDSKADRPGAGFEAELAARLRASEQLDYVTSARLSAARARAVAQRPQPGAFALGRAVLALVLAPPRAAMLSLLAVTLSVVGWHSLQPLAEPPTTRAHAERFELLLDEHGPEFYADLELYQWLDEPGV